MSLWLRLCPPFVWSPLAGSAHVCLKASPSICTLSFVFLLCPFFCFCIVCLGFVCPCLCPDLYTELGHAVSLCSAGPRLNRLSLSLWWCMLHALLVFSMTSVFCLLNCAGAHASSCLKTVWGLCWCNVLCGDLVLFCFQAHSFPSFASIWFIYLIISS